VSTSSGSIDAERCQLNDNIRTHMTPGDMLSDLEDFREFCGTCLKIYVSTKISENLIIYGL